MSKYEALRSQFAAAWEAHDHYWADLERMVGGVRDAFGAHLGINPETLVGVRGESVPAISIGKIVDGGFVSCPVSQLERSHNRLSFVLRLSFSHDKLVTPRFDQLTFNLSIACEEGLYEVQDGSNHFQPLSFQVPPFNDLFEHLLSSIRV